MFVNTFTASDKSSVLNREYLRQSIHIQFTQKQKKFFAIFFAFLKSRLHFEHIQKKMPLIPNLYPKLRRYENVVR